MLHPLTYIIVALFALAVGVLVNAASGSLVAIVSILVCFGLFPSTKEADKEYQIKKAEKTALAPNQGKRKSD